MLLDPLVVRIEVEARVGGWVSREVDQLPGIAAYPLLTVDVGRRVGKPRDVTGTELPTVHDAPADIHSQQGIGGDAWELVYFARDPTTHKRLYFDPDQELVEERAPV